MTIKIESAMRFADQCIEIGEAVNNPWNLSLAKLLRAQVQAALGEWGSAVTDLEECIRIGEQAGFVLALTLVPLALGRLLREIGQLEQARSIHREAYRVAKRRAPFLIRAMESQLAIDAFAEGRVDEGSRWLQVVREREPPGAIGAAWLVPDFPAVAAVRGAEHTGDWTTAEQMVEQALEEAKRRRLPVYVPRLLCEYGRCLVGLGRMAKAEPWFGEAVGAANDAGLRPVMWEAHAALSQLYRARNRLADANSERNMAAEIALEIANSFEDTAYRHSFLGTPAIQSVLNR